MKYSFKTMTDFFEYLALEEGVGVILIIIFLFIGIRLFIKFNYKNSFLNIQANLPTSKIRSMVMGLVEVSGKTIMQKPLLSKIGEKECIGYRYKIESLVEDSGKKKAYSTISDEVICNDFELEDNTGKVTVKAEGIDFIWVKEDDSYENETSMKRYTQYLLFNNDKILLIANANSDKKSTFLEKGTTNTIFTLAPYDIITIWNTNKPLLNFLLFFGALFILFVAFILFSTIDLKENNIEFTFTLPWANFNL